MSAAVALEGLAVALYESDCRHRSESMARRTTLSRIRAHYSFASWAELTGRERAAWRDQAQRLLNEQDAQHEENRQWERAAT